MRKKGKVVYVPPSVFEELNNIMNEDDIPIQAEAFKGMVKYSQVGREAKKIFDRGFPMFSPKKKRRKRRR